MFNIDVQLTRSSTSATTLYEPSSGPSILFSEFNVHATTKEVLIFSFIATLDNILDTECTLAKSLTFNVHAENKLVGRCVIGNEQICLTPGPNAFAGQLHFCPQPNDTEAILAGRHMFEAYINNTDYEIVLDIATKDSNNDSMEEADLELFAHHLGGTRLRTRVPHLSHPILRNPRCTASLFSMLGWGRARTQSIINNPTCVDIKANRFRANLFSNPDNALLGCIEVDYGHECIVFPAHTATPTPIFSITVKLGFASARTIIESLGGRFKSSAELILDGYIGNYPLSFTYRQSEAEVSFDNSL
jgi:hypothetical protein